MKQTQESIDNFLQTVVDNNIQLYIQCPVHGKVNAMYVELRDNIVTTVCALCYE